MKYFALAVLALGFAAPALAQDQEPLADGLYRITRSGARRAQVVPLFEAEERLLIHDGRFLEPDPDRQTQLVVVGIVPDAPISLAAEPEETEDEEGRGVVRARLGQKALADLEGVARLHRGTGIALVLDGEIAHAARLSDVLATGSIEIVGCREGACSLLRQQLTGRVEK